MNRLSLIFKERKTGVLIALAALTIAVLAAVGSGAWFTSTLDNGGNEIVAGNMSLSNTPDSAFLTAQNIAPGDDVVGTVAIKNEGSVDGDLWMSLSGIDETAGDPSGLDNTTVTGDVLSNDMTLSIEDLDTGVTVLQPTPVTTLMDNSYMHVKDELLPIGATHHFKFTAHLINNSLAPTDVDNANNNSDNAYQGADSTLQFTWQITSTPPHAAS